MIIRRKCYAEDITYPSASFNVYLYLFPFVPLVHPPSWVPETHMGALPPGKPVWVPIHSVLTLPPSVNSSPVCCSFANRTIQMVSSLLSPRPPTLAPSEGRGDSLSDLCSSQNTLHIYRPCSLIQWDDLWTRPMLSQSGFWNQKRIYPVRFSASRHRGGLLSVFLPLSGLHSFIHGDGDTGQ